jgi:hypothetical protein
MDHLISLPGKLHQSAHSLASSVHWILIDAHTTVVYKVHLIVDEVVKTTKAFTDMEELVASFHVLSAASTNAKGTVNVVVKGTNSAGKFYTAIS